MKKKIIILLSSLILIIGAVGVYKYTYKPKQEPPEINSYDEKVQYNKKFAEAGGITIDSEDQGHVIAGNEGGFTDIDVENRTSLLKVTDIDGLLSIDQSLAAAFKVMPTLYNEAYELQGSSLENYYKAHFDTLVSVFGIDSLDKFKSLLQEFSFLKDSKVAKAQIHESSINKKGNVFDCNLTITSDNGQSNTFKIRAVITLKDGKSSTILYWREENKKS